MILLFFHLVSVSSCFRINSNSLCPPILAASEALADLRHTRDQITTLTDPHISPFPNAVYRFEHSEVLAVPLKEADFIRLNPCAAATHTELFKPRSFAELRTILGNSDRDGVALFHITYDFSDNLYRTESGLFIRSGNCQVPDQTKENWTSTFIGALNLQKDDDVTCLPRPTLKHNFAEYTFKALCAGPTRTTQTTERLTAKKALLLAGIKLVETTLPRALEGLVKLRSLISWNKTQSNAKDSSKWSKPTPIPKSKNPRCIPTEVDLFDDPPSFKSIGLVTPNLYQSYESHVDTLVDYIDYLRSIQTLLTENSDSSHVRLLDNDYSFKNWFKQIFSSDVMPYTVPICLLTLIIFTLCLCTCSCCHSYFDARRYLPPTSKEMLAKQKFTERYITRSRGRDLSPTNIPLRALTPSAPVADLNDEEQPITPSEVTVTRSVTHHQ